jgi:hypothetical protein
MFNLSLGEKIASVLWGLVSFILATQISDETGTRVVLFFVLLLSFNIISAIDVPEDK